jgi:hypothetical protein
MRHQPTTTDKQPANRLIVSDGERRELFPQPIFFFSKQDILQYILLLRKNSAFDFQNFPFPHHAQ